MTVSVASRRAPGRFDGFTQVGRRFSGRTLGRSDRPKKPPRARRPEPQGAYAVLSTSTAMLSIVTLWVLLQLLVLGNLEHARSQTLLYREFRTQLAGATAPLGPLVPAGDPVALVRIPRIGIDEVVVEGTASGDLRAGPGHKRNTVLPGQAGVSLVYGRGATSGAPFRDLAELRTGDRIEVVMAQGEQAFVVRGVRREGDPLPPPPEDGAARLTLVSAEGGGRLAAISPGSTVYVDAEAEEGFPAPSGRPPSVPESEDAMQGDSEALPGLCLGLGLLIALTLGVLAARQRWSRGLVWVVATPLALAVAWGTTDAALRLLPNLI